MSSVNAYVIWSNEHGAWWGPKRAGYVARLTDAGKYARDEALTLCTDARGGREYNRIPSELPILLADAEVFWPDSGIELQEKAIQRRQMQEAQWASASVDHYPPREDEWDRE